MQRKIGSTRKKRYEELCYYVYLYEEFQNNFFVRKKVRIEELTTRKKSKKVRIEELATRNILFYGQKNYSETPYTNIRSSIMTRTVFDEESP